MFKSVLTALVLCLLLGGLAGCGNDQGTDEPVLPTATNSTADEERQPALKVEETEHGETIVDGDGRTVYAYADDEQGAAKSTCAGPCLDAWPAVPAPSKIDIDDLSGDVGLTKAADGTRQLTYNGWPLYYFKQDTEPGDAKGQGVKEQWWILNEAGEMVQE